MHHTSTLNGDRSAGANADRPAGGPGIVTEADGRWTSVCVSSALRGYWPVPVRVMVWGESAALSVRVMDAVSGPTALGAKRAPMRHWAPGARLPPKPFPVGPLQVLDVKNEDALVPPSVMVLK